MSKLWYILPMLAFVGVIVFESRGECQVTPFLPIPGSGVPSCTTVITTTPEGGTRTCLVCTQPGGPTTVSCS